jgi:hypothetical protein
METTSISAAGELAPSLTDRSRCLERRIGRFVVSGVAVLALAQTAYVVWAPSSEAHGTALFGIVLYGCCAASAALALTLVWRSSAASGALPLAAFLALLASVMSHVGLYRWSTDAHLSSLWVGVLDLALPAAILYMTAALVRFSALFPQPLEAADFRSGGRLRAFRVAALRPGASWLPASALFAAAVLVTVTNPELIRYVRPAMLALVLGAFVLSVSNLRVAYRAAAPDGRRRMFWVFEGLLATVVIFAVASALRLIQMIGGGTTGKFFTVSMIVAFLVLVVCLTIAMFFSGALDPALTIKRTAVYGLLGVALVFVFVAVENTVQDHFRAWLGLSDSSSGIIIGGTVALTVEPIKHQISRLAERMLARWGVVPEPKNPH